MSDKKEQAAPAKKDVLKELMAQVADLKLGTATTVTDEAQTIMAACAVHALGILAEIATYQRVIAETSAITLQMKQMQGAPGGLAMGPGGLVIPRK